MLPSLGNSDTQDTVLQAGLNTILVDAAGEAESAGELANGTFRDPILLLRLLLLLLLLLLLSSVLGNSASFLGLLGFLILDRDLVRLAAFLLLLAAFGDGTARLGPILNEAGGRSARLVGALDLAMDHDGLWLGELNVDILALDARELAVQLVGVLRLADVELGVEMPRCEAALAVGGSRVGVAALAPVVVKVVEQTEERGEGGGVGGVEVAREE